MKWRQYFDTLKYLKYSQILWRLYYRVVKVNTKALVQQALPLQGALVAWQVYCHKAPKLMSATQANFLNESKSIAASDIWQDSRCDPLWLYNLHYFDDLVAKGAPQRNAWHQVLIQRWISENPVGKGVGWQPYPLSLRIVNWVKWALMGNELTYAMQHSLALQVRFLMKRLEWHLLGNHLLANAKALIFAGCFFTGAEADKWLHKGLAILQRQLSEQMLADGGHFELSPMYQGIILEDLFDLLQLFRLYHKELPTVWQHHVSQGLDWLQAMSHPDGQISFFNDAAFNIAPSWLELQDYAIVFGLSRSTEPEAVKHLKASGYVRLHKADAVLLADVAAVGPDYLPGHAHADTLSFELSLKGQRLLVNSGTSTYSRQPLRRQQRGTLAHNTITIDGQDSSQVWGAFRVAQRARVHNISLAESADHSCLQAEHDGYQRLTGKPRHQRSWRLFVDRLHIEDMVHGQGQHHLDSRLHLAPGLTAVLSNDNSAVIRNQQQQCIATITASHTLNIIEACYYPEFNDAQSNQVLSLSLQATLPMCMTWTLCWNQGCGF